MFQTHTRLLAATAALALLPAAAVFPQAFTEGFDNIATLPGAGWAQINRSNPLGGTSWFQGNPPAPDGDGPFPSHTGAPNSYIAANFNNTGDNGTISNWLLTPTVPLANGATLSFWTRTTTPEDPAYPDRLQVRMSTAGTSTDVGTTEFDVGVFTTLLLDINPTYSTTGYPSVYTQYTVTVSGLAEPTGGRIAFRYFVEDAGFLGVNGDYIGIDTVAFTPTGGVTFHRGDFNLDNKTDILWRHDVSGQNVAWFMNGATLTSGSFLTPAALSDTNWKMVGTHDFNADLKTDILWRHEVSGENVVWYMSATVLTSGTFLTPAALVDTNWKMAGTGLFNAGAQPDIVWHHQVSGQVVVWYMNGSVLTSGTFTTPSSLPDTNWQLRGVADFNSDTKPDLLWRHKTSGQIVVWYMDNATLLSGTFTTPSAEPDTNWQIVAVGDYSVPLDGKPDIVWRHAVSGQNRIWFMDGVTLTSGVSTTTLADPNWKIVGPR